MKKFIINSLILSIFPVLFVFVTIVTYKYRINNIKIDDSIHILISGDSHTQTGIDDSKIENSLNISQLSEHFLYSFNILNLLLENNSQIKTVILGVSFHSFSKEYDRYIHDEDKTKHMFPRYFPILDIESIKDINKLPIRQFNGIFKNIVKGLFNNTKISEYSFIGNFHESNICNLNDSTINVAIQRHYFTETGDMHSYSHYQIKYLNKIIELCNTKNVELIIINTPIHYNYYKKIPINFVSNYYSTIQQFGDKISFWDFFSVDFPKDYYGDGDHLNSFGAGKFSLIISERINEKILARAYNTQCK
jgi:RNase H-fold protein (predicted Holliday junction resolvase)